jgi:hypothetical protein
MHGQQLQGACKPLRLERVSRCLLAALDARGLCHALYNLLIICKLCLP